MIKDFQNKDAGKRDGPSRNYGLVMDKREQISLTGVNDVLSFDETGVVLRTEGGEVSILGADLHVKRLMLEEGQLVIVGAIDAITYQDHKPPKKAARVMSRLFK